MTKKPRFGIPSNVKHGLGEMINMVEDYTGNYTDTLIPIARIIFDAENPRKLYINRNDLPQGPLQDDPFYKEKSEEFESLTQLANSIRNEGIIHPVVVYRADSNFKLIAGERRCLASLIAQKRSIEARVFNKEPTPFKLKLIQWAENNSREDLSLFQRIMNMKDIIEAYKQEHKKSQISAIELSEIIHLSRPQITYYLSVINATEDLHTAIRDGKVTNLDKAALIAKIDDKIQRERMIRACELGTSLNALRQLIPVKASLQSNQKEKFSSKINLGFTKKPQVIKLIVNAIFTQPLLQPYHYQYSTVNWNNIKQAQSAMKNLIALLEDKIEILNK